MKRKCLISLDISCLLIAVAVILMGFYLPQARAGEKATASTQKAPPKLEIRAGHISPAGTAFYERTSEWTAHLVEQATDGRVKITHYPGQSLVKGPDMYRALEEGTLDFGFIWGPLTPGAFPLSDVFSLPGLFTCNIATAHVVLNILYDKYPQFEEQFSPKVKFISTQVHLRTHIHSTVPIRSLADFKGKVIGCQSDTIAKALAKFGASTSVIDQVDFYMSGERGVVDGVACAWGAVGVFKLHEVYKYHTIIGFSPGTSHYLFNRKTWNKFALDEQAKIELLRPWFQRAMNEGCYAAVGMALWDEVLPPEKGHEIIALPDKEMKEMRDRLRPMWNEWAEEMEAKGYPGKAIVKDAELLVERYSEL